MSSEHRKDRSLIMMLLCNILFLCLIKVAFGQNEIEERLFLHDSGLEEVFRWRQIGYDGLQTTQCK